MIYLTRRHLEDAFRRAGRPHNSHWIIKRENEGKLVCPRDPTNGFRIFTQEQIDEIVQAFSLDGSGKWIYRPKNLFSFLRGKY